MRRNFKDILNSFNFDVNYEYNKLLNLFVSEKINDNTNTFTVFEYMDTHFIDLDTSIRKTCLSLTEFNKLHNYTFCNKKHVELQDLISLAEYIYNFIFFFKNYSKTVISGYSLFYLFIKFLQDHIDVIIDSTFYDKYFLRDEKLFIFIPKDPTVCSVVESDLIPDESIDDIIKYNHYSNCNDVYSKRGVLQKIAPILEGKRLELKHLNKSLESDLFFILNNFNIRHNNLDRDNEATFNVVLESMSDHDLILLYDNTYRMFLLAVMTLDYAAFKKNIDKLKISK